jgi:di/tricarboxylate transporter
MFDFAFWYTASLLVIMTTVLVLEWIEADIAIFSVLILLIVGGVIDVEEAFVGFSNPGMLTILFLFIVAAAMQKIGVVNQIGEALLGKTGGITKKLFRFLPPISAISAFFNNTPIVAMLIPVVRGWSKKNQISVSKLLIPLSYATILGGTCTLIGTSTNLVVHGLMLENGLQGMGFFEISRVGIPVALFGLAVIILFVHRLLPDRKEPLVELGEETREFVVVMKVEKGYPHIGKSIEEAGLRHLKGLFLFEIERHAYLLNSVGPDEKIQLYDRLFFTGLPETIMELQKTQGLSLLKDAVFDLKNYDSDNLRTFEVVVSANSPLVGKNVRESNFRRNYDAVIIAIHRSGERIRQKVGNIVIRPGDTLLILAKHNFMQQWYHTRDFYLVSRSVDIPSKPRWYSYFSLGILGAMIVAMAFGVIPVLVAVSAAAAILVISRCITTEDARSNVDWKVLLIIASAFGIAKGLDNSGVAHFLAVKLVDLIGSLGILAMLAAVYFVTNFYTSIITNNAAAALLVPVALSTANQAGFDPRAFLFAVAIAASASFATPIGYQTNLMVYGPGGYKFKDFLKVGVPLNILVGIVAVLTIYFLYS